MGAMSIYSCGCSFTREMDENHTLVNVDFCWKHRQEHPEILEFLLKEMKKIQNEENKT